MTWTQSAMPETLFDKYLLAVAQGELASQTNSVSTLITGSFWPNSQADAFAERCVKITLALFAAREKVIKEVEDK